MLPTDRFLTFIQQHKLYDLGKKVLLAVSGGRDSVLMVKLFNAAGLQFGIAHCNFNLRGEESEGDEKFVKELAKELKVDFFSIKFDTKGYADQNKLSIQMAARELRYQWLEETRKENFFDGIALAHHASDVTETVLLNLTRGTGIAGLHGILPKRASFIRPLLFLKREEIDEIVRTEGLSFREDSSNLSSKYARNKIRLEVVPKLKELNPNLDDTFEKNSKRFTQIEEFLNNEVNKLREALFKELSGSLVEIDLDALKELQPLELLMYELFKPFNFSEAVLQDLMNSWEGQAGKMFLSSTHILILDRARLILDQKTFEVPEEVSWDQNMAGASFQLHSYSSKAVDKEVGIIVRDSQKAFFDESLLQYPLTLRLWKEGDYFYPFGMKGKKKLSDFLRELKIPLTQKRKIPLLVNGNGDILWIIGYRTDDRYKVTPETKKVIIFKQT